MKYTIKKFTRRHVRAFQRQFRKNPVPTLAVTALGVYILIYASYMSNQQKSVDPASYASLLNLVAQAESNGNYNAYFGNAGNAKIDFTSMTIAEVLAWQSDFVEDGSPSSAVGRYQILNTTLSGLIEEHGISDQELYDQQMQDNLAVKLLERRGSIAYVNDQLTHDEFAANVAQEWASLPKVVGENPDDSYYRGDGLNKALVEVDEVRDAVKQIEPEI